jgi:hypothetical protein
MSFSFDADVLDRIVVGYGIAYTSFLPWIHRHTKIRKRDPTALQPESRLYWLLFSEFCGNTKEEKI